MASPIHIDIPHTLGRDEAMRRLRDGIGQIAGQIPGGATVETTSPAPYRMSLAVNAMGQSVSGTLEIEERTVRCELWLPPLLSLFADKIRRLTTQKAGQLLLDHTPQP